MISNTLHEYQNPRANERHDLTPTACGGFMVRLTGQFPLSDLDILMPPCGPLQVRTLIDTDGDSIADHEAVSELTFHDLDGDGVLERDDDALRIRTRNVSVIQPVPFDFDGADRAATAKRVVFALGGNPGDVVEPADEPGDRWDGQSRA